MMNINRDNYEMFAVDYIDGNLSPATAAEFIAFLAEHPDIAADFDQVRKHPTNYPDSKISPDFSILKKDLNKLTITQENFEEFCIAYYEKDLNEKTRERLLSFIAKDDTLKLTFHKYKQVRLLPDKNVLFSSKKELKQTIQKPLWLNKIAVVSSLAAAGIAIFLIFRTYSANDSYNKNTGSIIISQNDTVHSKPSYQSQNISSNNNLINKEDLNKTFPHQPESHMKGETIAAADTNPYKKDTLKPLSGIRVNNMPYLANLSTISIPDYKSKPSGYAGESRLITNVKTVGEEIIAKTTKITFPDIVQTGLTGFNRLTESNYKFEAKTNEKGKITEFALSSESFNLKRKIGRN